MSSNLKLKSIKAVKWTLIEAVGLRGVQFVVGVILARLLRPEQFGLIGMLLVFMALAQVFLDSGFGAALIQKQDITPIDVSSIFYFNILIGLIAVVCLYGFAPWVAAFYAQPILTPLLRLMSLALVINAFGLVQNVLIRKALDFKTETKVSLIASIISGIIGVTMAYQGFGVWSLAAQQLSAGIIRTALLWVFNRWRPIWGFSLQSLRAMFGFGSKLLCANLLQVFFENIYYIVIGKAFSPTQLGYYTRADNLQKMPSQTLSAVMLKVAFPVFSTIQNDLIRVKRGMRIATANMAFINFPVMIGLALVARPLISVLLTDKWLPSVPYLQALCLVGLIYPMQLINMSVLQSLGRSDLYLRLQFIVKLLIVVNIVLTLRFGIMAMVVGQVFITYSAFMFSSLFHQSITRYSLLNQLTDISPYLLCALLMASVVYPLVYFPIENELVLLISQCSLGGITYFMFCWMCRLPIYIEYHQKIFQKLKLFSNSSI